MLTIIFYQPHVAKKGAHLLLILTYMHVLVLRLAYKVKVAFYYGNNRVPI